jgi:hypothetical protein
MKKPPSITQVQINMAVSIRLFKYFKKTALTAEGCSVWRMKHIFGRDIFNAVAEATLIAKAPSYKTILDLDHKVRELSFSAAFKPYVMLEDGEEEFYSGSLSLRGFYASQHRSVSEYVSVHELINFK